MFDEIPISTIKFPEGLLHVKSLGLAAPKLNTLVLYISFLCIRNAHMVYVVS